MPTFSYRAIDSGGETIKGQLEVADKAAAVKRLQTDGLMLLDIVEGASRESRSLRDLLTLSRSGSQINYAKLTHFTRELATLLDAGLTLDRGMQILIELSDDEAFNRLLDGIRDAVHSGATFSQALKEQGDGVFPPLYISMVKAGEAGGALQNVLNSLADYLEGVTALRENIRSALIYPILLLSVAGISVAVLLMFVVPQFQQMFDDMGKALPVSTQIVIASGDFLRTYWWLLLAAVLLGVAVMKKLLERPDLRFKWDGRLLRLPLIGDLLAKIETARFSRTLATLLENGLPLQRALILVHEVVGNRVIAAGLQKATESLERGAGLSVPLAEGKVLPPLALQMIKVGEESGALETMLKKIATVYDGEVSNAVKRMLTMLEPILIIGLGILVAGIIVSILMAILSANELAF